MFEDGDFYIDDDELAEDNQMSLVDDAILKAVTSMEKALNDLKNNLKFNEQNDARHNLRILSMHLDSAIQLSRIEEDELSEEEVYEAIENVIKQTTELTFSNMDELLPKEEIPENISSGEAGSIDTDFDF
jgi:hypothetical protein